MRWLLISAFFAGAFARAQQAPQVYGFHFVRPGLPVPEYQFRLCMAPGCESTYTTVGETPGDPHSSAGKKLDLSGPMRARIVSLFDATHGLTRCASKAKGIADTGSKTLSTADISGGNAVSCTYNYSESKPVVELTTIFQGMAFTLDEERKLAHLHRYDRLGLDAEMMNLYTAAQDGRALEMGNIAPELRALADDTDVLERVRLRAAALLQMAANGGSLPKG